MSSCSMDTRTRPRSEAQRAVYALVRLVWALARAPILAFLIILEPIVTSLLWLFATLGVLSALFYRFLVQDPRFPFWLGLGLSIGLAFVAALYHGLVRLLGGPRD